MNNYLKKDVSQELIHLIPKYFALDRLCNCKKNFVLNYLILTVLYFRTIILQTYISISSCLELIKNTLDIFLLKVVILVECRTKLQNIVLSVSVVELLQNHSEMAPLNRVDEEQQPWCYELKIVFLLAIVFQESWNKLCSNALHIPFLSQNFYQTS